MSNTELTYRKLSYQEIINGFLSITRQYTVEQYKATVEFLDLL